MPQESKLNPLSLTPGFSPVIKTEWFKSHLNEVIMALCGALIIIGSLAVSNGGIFALAQGKHKSISRGTILRNAENDPIRISEIKVGANRRHFEEQFDDDDDWLKKVALQIENHWNKPIVYLMITLSFPETNSSGNEMMFPVYLGNKPGSRLPAKRESVSIAPGEKVVVNLAERYDWLLKFIESRHSMSQINKVELEVALAVADDKTAWGGGVFFIQDANNPEIFVPVPESSPAP